MTTNVIGETDMTKTNDELKQELAEISKMMRDLSDHNRNDERNSFVPRVHELRDKLIDWGFRAGEPVERRTGRGWEEDTILEVEGDKFHFRTMILPPEMIRRPKKPQLTVQLTATIEEYEQISLFG